MRGKAKGKECAGSQALMRGLEILRAIAESPEPLSSLEISRRVGLHQSWTSRVLKTLIEAGYVKKPGYRSFAPDYGILCLGGIAAQQFSLAKKPLPGLSELIRSLEGFEFALGCLWDSQIVYFLRVHNSLGASGPSAGRFPLQSSSIALRILLELPEAQALKALEDSRRRYGWECPGLELPPTPNALLKAARANLSDECLVWERKGASGVGASIILRLEGEPLAALALSGPAGVFSNERLALSLHEGRRIVEKSLR